jgi:hypothetical protein
MRENSFQNKYRELEERMRALAEKEGNVYVQNPRPNGQAQYVFICMEPSLGSSSPGELQARIEAGARNFFNSVEDFLLHFAARRYLCDSGERYHITDVSKGAMPVSQADTNRQQRYDRWYSLLRKEIDLVATSDAHCFAVGMVVSDFLSERNFQRPFSYLLHYSPQAARARNKGIEGHEVRFEAFRQSVSMKDVITEAEGVLDEAGLPDQFRDEALTRLEESRLTPSRKKLLFNYKLEFQSAPHLGRAG